MSTKLRVLIDEAIEDDVADRIASMQAFHAEYVRNLPHLKGRTDKEIMDYARTENRTVITLDHDYNSANFPICTHPGIIRISSACKHHTVVIDVMNRFSRSGYRSKVRHSIAHLTKEGCDVSPAIRPNRSTI